MKPYQKFSYVFVNKLGNQIECQLPDDQLWRQVEGHLRGRLDDQLWNHIERQIWDKLLGFNR